MARVSATSNPTKLKEIARKYISMTRTQISGRQILRILRMDLAEYDLPSHAKLLLIARAGNTSKRFDLGTVANWNHNELALDDLDFSKPLRFRLLVREETSPQLIATAENLRCTGDDDVESLLPIVAADMGQRLWHLVIDEDGPTLQCNSRVFPSGASAASYQPFASLVIPEALRQILQYLAKDPERVSVEGSVWAEWGTWMAGLDIDLPTPLDEDEKETWIEESTAKFCEHFQSAEALQSALEQGVSS